MKGNLIRFNFNDKMASEVIKANELKKSLKLMENKRDNLDKNSDEYKCLEEEIIKIKDCIDISKNKFIREFQLNNKKEIKQYNDLKR